MRQDQAASPQQRPARPATRRRAKASRGRGRPGASETGGDALREHIIVASTPVYAEFGHGQITVDKLMRAAEVSRPTFYRYFSDKYAVIDEIVQRANIDLCQRAIHALAQLPAATDAESMMAAGIDVYIDWCRDTGPVVGRIYSEIHDAQSPASVYRARTLQAFVQLFETNAKRLGRDPHDRLLYVALVHCVEQTISVAFWPAVCGSDELARRREVALRIMTASLNTSH